MSTIKIRLIKDYTPPAVQPLSAEDKILEVAYLKTTLRRLQSRCDRLEYEVQSEIKMLMAALDGRQETYEQVKRRLSQLRGSLEYPGHE